MGIAAAKQPANAGRQQEKLPANGVWEAPGAPIHFTHKILTTTLPQGLEVRLIRAFQEQNHPALVEALDDGAGVNLRDSDGYTLLMTATRFKDVEAVKILLARRANPLLKNDRGEDAKDLALAAGCEEIAAMIEDRLNLILLEAAANGDLETSKEAIQAGAEPFALDARGRSALGIAKARDHEQVASYLQAEINDDLFIVVSEGNLEEAKAAIAAGADGTGKNDEGLTAYQLAAKLQQLELAALLKQKLDEVLLTSSEEGNLERVKAAHEAGADINSADEANVSGLMNAVTKGYLKIAEYFLNNGADVNAKDSLGRSALVHAVIANEIEMVRLLRTRYADVTALKTADANDLSALLLQGHPEMKAIFEEMLNEQLIITMEGFDLAKASELLGMGAEANGLEGRQTLAKLFDELVKIFGIQKS